MPLSEMKLKRVPKEIKKLNYFYLQQTQAVRSFQKESQSEILKINKKLTRLKSDNNLAQKYITDVIDPNTNHNKEISKKIDSYNNYNFVDKDSLKSMNKVLRNKEILELEKKTEKLKHEQWLLDQHYNQCLMQFGEDVFHVITNIVKSKSKPTFPKTKWVEFFIRLSKTNID